MKRLLFLSVLPFFLLACGEEERPPESEVTTSPSAPAETAPSPSGSSEAGQVQPPTAPAASGSVTPYSTADEPLTAESPAWGAMAAGGSADKPLADSRDGDASRIDGSHAASDGNGRGAPGSETGAPGAEEVAPGTADVTPGTAADATVITENAAAGMQRRAEGGAGAGAELGSEYEVVQGDTLVDIARDHRVELAQLRAWNPDVNPRRLQIGQMIRLAPSAAAKNGSSPGSRSQSREHKVEAGETMYSIAREHRVGLGDLQAWNPQANPRQLQIGQILRLAPPFGGDSQ